MKVLLSSIGSRGDVQPIIALALELRARGHEPRLCVAPNFKAWVESFGLTCLPIGPDLKRTGGSVPKGPVPKLSAEQLQQLASATVLGQFPILEQAAQGCDLIVAAGSLQLATRSIAESLKIPYVFAAYCPAVLPSANHPPAKLGDHYPQSATPEANLALWEEEEQSWNSLFRDPLNDERAKRGLQPVASVPRHIFTDRPWLAADPSLAPAGPTTELHITQVGAWRLRDERPLPDHVQKFLSSGEPPVYFGFGSMRSTEGNSRAIIESARALGLRSIVSQGWGNLAPIDEGSDCLCVDDLSHEQLFPRVAAIVHHGGAGTTTAAACAGKPQVIVPHLYDQYYFAYRMQQLHIGVAGPTSGELTTATMTSALRAVTSPDLGARAQAFASRLELRGAAVAADRLIRGFA